MFPAPFPETARLTAFPPLQYTLPGAVSSAGERLPYKQDVTGSNPVPPTSPEAVLWSLVGQRPLCPTPLSMNGLMTVAAALLLVAISPPPPWAQDSPRAVFSNPQPIQIPSSGASNPYPSFISVMGVGGTVAEVTVHLSGVSHRWPEDLDILLVGPQGQSVLLFSDAGGQGSLENVDLTFDDDAAAPIPNSSRGGIPAGTYRPSNYGDGWDSLPLPAPQGACGQALSVFRGTDPNGTWQLYVYDDMGGDPGGISMGWSLIVTAAP